MQLTAPISAPRRLPGMGNVPAWLLWGAPALLLVIAAATVAYQRLFAPAAPAIAGQVVPVSRAAVASTVSATGSTVAAKQAKLVFQSSGRIRDIPVALGQQVQAGQPLARLGAESQQVKLDQARSQHAAAQIKLEQLTEGATAEEVAAAQAAYDAAMAKLSDVEQGPTTADIEAARATLLSARSSYEQASLKLQHLLSGGSTADRSAAEAGLESARSALATAEAKLALLKEGPTPEDITTAQSSVDQARAGLRSAEAKLEQVRAGATNADLAAAQATYDQAANNLNSARVKLDQVRLTVAVAVDVAAAQASLAKAEQDLAAARKSLDSKQDDLLQARADYEYRTNAVEVQKQRVSDACSAGQTTACREAESALDAAYSAQLATEIKLRNLDGVNAPEMRLARQAVTSAQAAYDSARAKFDQTRAAASVPADLVAAQTAYDNAASTLVSARAKLDQVRSGSLPADLAAAQSGLDQARATLAGAEAKLRTTLSGATNADLVAAQTAAETARANLASAEAKLAAVASPAPSEVAAQRAAVDGARASVQGAQAKLATLLAGATEADLKSAQSAVASAQSSLTLKAGSARSSDIALQMESVRQAELAVRQAQIDLDNMTLVAPFDGVVAAIAGNVGESAPSGQTGFITLIDPRETRVDVTVDESDVAKLQIGKRGLVTFDALPTQPFVGKVVAVSPSGTVTQGVVSYLVAMNIEPFRAGPNGNAQGLALGALAPGNRAEARAQAPGTRGQQSGEPPAAGQGQRRESAAATAEGPLILPSGLTATALITIEQRDDVLSVPSRAIRRQGRDQVVEVKLPDGKTEMRVVRTGIQSDQSIEILDGLQEGEEVVVRTTTTRQPTVGGPGGFTGGGPPGGFQGGAVPKPGIGR